MTAVKFDSDNKAYITINKERIYIDKCLKRSKLKSLLSAKTKVKKPRNVKRKIVSPLPGITNISPSGTYLSSSLGNRPSMSSLSTSEQRRLEQDRREMEQQRRQNAIINTIIPAVIPAAPPITPRPVRPTVPPIPPRPIRPSKKVIQNLILNTLYEHGNKLSPEQESILENYPLPPPIPLKPLKAKKKVILELPSPSPELKDYLSTLNKKDKDFIKGLSNKDQQLMVDMYGPNLHRNKIQDLAFLHYLDKVENLTDDEIDFINNLEQTYNLHSDTYDEAIKNLIYYFENEDQLKNTSIIKSPVINQEEPYDNSPNIYPDTIPQSNDILIDTSKNEIDDKKHLKDARDLAIDLRNQYQQTYNNAMTATNNNSKKYPYPKGIKSYSPYQNFVTLHKSEFKLLRDLTVQRQKGSIESIDAELTKIISMLTQKIGNGKKESIDKNGLSNFQIDKLMKKYGDKYLGTISHDEIPSLISKIKPKSSGGFVINTDPASKDGKHWQAIYYDGEKDMEIDFYDSFGDPPSKTIMKGVKMIADKLDADNYLKFKNNKIKQQDNRSSNCGFFSAKFLIDRFAGKHFQDASGWNDAVKDNSTKGEEEIMKFRKQVGYGTPWQYIKSFAKKAINIVPEVINRVTTAIRGRTHAPPAVRSILQKYGNVPVKSIDVCRTPVNSVITGILNTISLGQLEENKKNLHYDQIYHLYAVIHLDNGYSFTIERNESIKVHKAGHHPNTDCISVGVDGKVTLVELIHNAADGNSTFWQYNWQTSNCQMFIRDLLQKSGLLTSELSSFISQDASGLLKDSPLTQKIADIIPDIGSKIDVLIHGAARKKKLTCKDLILGVDKNGKLTARKKGGCCESCL